jgi:hypothetical protein
MSTSTSFADATRKGTASRWLRAAAFAAACVPVVASAASWRDHAQPYVFLFGNDIDTHQQTFAQANGELFGFFYVKFTGAVTADGLRVARHVDCSAEPGWAAGDGEVPLPRDAGSPGLAGCAERDSAARRVHALPLDWLASRARRSEERLSAPAQGDRHVLFRA